MKAQLSWLLASNIAVAAARPLKHQAAQSPTYFFSFGDSYTSTNFDTTGEQPSASNPMGNPALGTSTTTGGINWIGYLTTAENSSLVLSYNLAVGGATVDNTIVAGYPSDLVSEVDVFKNTYSSKPASAPWTAQDAVFAFWMGVNDAGNGFYQTNAAALLTQLIAKYQSLVEEVYTAGGRKFLLLNVPPTSRSPFFLDQGDATVSQHAAYVALFNEQLETMAANLRKKYADVLIVSYDSFSFMTDVLDNPTTYGFADATCINSDGVSCVWWNNYHPSAKYHELQAKDMKKVLGPLGAW